MDSHRNSGGPDIFEYLDYRAFLRDWIEHRKETWPEFSYEYFTRRAGLGSKATLHNVISGRRNPRPDTVDAFAKAMELSAPESAYLQKLVELALSRTLDERREVLTTIIETPDFNKSRQIKGDDSREISRFMARWYCHAIWELARAPNFRADPDWLSRTLVPSISRAQAAEALEILFQGGFLHREDDGAIRVNEIRLDTGVTVDNLAIRSFYQSTLDNAKRALDTFSADERVFLGGTFFVPSGHLPELQRKAVQFNRQLVGTGDEANLETARVYQLCLLLFPLTHAPGEEPDEGEDGG